MSGIIVLHAARVPDPPDPDPIYHACFTCGEKVWMDGLAEGHLLIGADGEEVFVCGECLPVPRIEQIVRSEPMEVCGGPVPEAPRYRRFPSMGPRRRV